MAVHSTNQSPSACPVCNMYHHHGQHHCHYMYHPLQTVVANNRPLPPQSAPHAQPRIQPSIAGGDGFAVLAPLILQWYPTERWVFVYRYIRARPSRAEPVTCEGQGPCTTRVAAPRLHSPALPKVTRSHAHALTNPCVRSTNTCTARPTNWNCLRIRHPRAGLAWMSVMTCLPRSRRVC